MDIVVSALSDYPNFVPGRCALALAGVGTHRSGRDARVMDVCPGKAGWRWQDSWQVVRHERYEGIDAVVVRKTCQW